MNKYLGNKKTILESIENFMNSKGIKDGTFCDIFTGTTNVAQYFKQREFNIISNDYNQFCYSLQATYIYNNEFPQFKLLLDSPKFEAFNFINEDMRFYKNSISQRISKNIIYDNDYINKYDYMLNMEPLIKVIIFLNNLEVTDLSSNDLFIYDYYTKWGSKSEFKSNRGTKGKRNYFNEYNGKKIGVILGKIKKWYLHDKLINEVEFHILLTALIEEVVLVANVNGTFHDFNRKKLYPNATVNMKLKPPIINICDKDDANYKIFKSDANILYKKKEYKNIDNIDNIDVLYIDPPYNFRQYSSYYHFLNFIGHYHEIKDLDEYGSSLKYVRGQNMDYNIKSDYCYKNKFKNALKNLIKNVRSEHIIISYYDENNHWNHGKDDISNRGREIIYEIFEEIDDIVYYDKKPFEINRQNYQSSSGHKKKIVKELLFYAKR